MKIFYSLISLFLLLNGICTQIVAQTNPDSVTFETSIPAGVIRIDSGSLWQIGSPHKTFFSSAHHGSQAIVTDTLNNYPANDTSRFIYTLYPPYISTCGTTLSFLHKYDMDTLGDKGIIEVSYDGGHSWISLQDTSGASNFSGPFMFNWQYDYHETSATSTIHNPIINGKSDGWIRSSFYWMWYFVMKSDTIIINPDSLMLRFTFISDSIIKNKEGWMIDDISVWYETLCSGILVCPPADYLKIYPNPSSGIVYINFGDRFESTRVEIINSLGQMVLTKNINTENTAEIDLSGQPIGPYFIKFLNAGGVQIRKVMLE